MNNAWILSVCKIWRFFVISFKFMRKIWLTFWFLVCLFFFHENKIPLLRLFEQLILMLTQCCLFVSCRSGSYLKALITLGRRSKSFQYQFHLQSRLVVKITKIVYKTVANIHFNYWLVKVQVSWVITMTMACFENDKQAAPWYGGKNHFFN